MRYQRDNYDEVTNMTNIWFREHFFSVELNKVMIISVIDAPRGYEVLLCTVYTLYDT